MAKASSKGSKPVKRRTFTGCETCRHRKVKCDGKKPQCDRCIRSGLQCLGYGINLKFCEPLQRLENGALKPLKHHGRGHRPQTDSHVQRRQVPFMKFPPALNYTDWETMDEDLGRLSDSEVENTHKEAVQYGPFGCFHAAKRIVTAPKMPPKISAIPLRRDLSTQTSIGPRTDSYTFETSSFPTSFTTPSLPSILNTPSPSVSDEDEIVPRKIWIHPRLQIDALLTYKALLGDADADSEQDYGDPEKLQRVCFSEYYGSTDALQCRIVDKFDVSAEQYQTCIEFQLQQVAQALKMGTPCSNLAAVLRDSQVQGLLRIVVRSFKDLLFLAFQGSILDKVVAPAIYKVVGEIMLNEGMLPGQTEFEQYCQLVRESLILVTLSLAFFEQYKHLFNGSGIYQGSLSYLRCYIAFREMSLVSLARLLKPLIGENYSEDDPVCVKNTTLLHKLVGAGLIKEFILTLILAIKQDDLLNVVLNYRLLYTLLYSVREKLLKRPYDDPMLEIMLLWVKYYYFFFYATATIDVAHYQVKEPGFEDLDENYNLIRNFSFEETSPQEEFAKIVIEPGTAPSMRPKEPEFTTLAMPGLPRKLQNRVPLDDKPARSFTVRFRFNGSEVVENEVVEKSPPVPHPAIKSPQQSLPVPFDSSQVDDRMCVELSYGIPLSLLDLMYRAVTIANHNNWFLRKKVFPRNFPKFCCDLEEELMAWRIPWDLSNKAENGRLEFHSLFHEAQYHLILCFYNSIVMFFLRLLKNMDPNLLQKYVVSTLEHMEKLRRLSLTPEFAKSFQITPPFWCFFVCGSDAVDKDLQTRYDSLGRVWYDVGDKWIGKQMMMEIWRGRNCGEVGEDEASWLDLIKGWEMSGFH